MFVEYLFDVNPITMLLIGISTIFFVYFQTKQSTLKNGLNFNTIEIVKSKFVANKKKASKKSDFSIMNYNIMAYNFTKSTWYSYCDYEYLSTKYRAPRILLEIKQIKPDVVCLQECDHDLFTEFYKPNLERIGYECYVNPLSTNKIVTVVTCILKESIRIVNKDYLDLNEGLDKLDENFIKYKEALILELSHKITGKQFIVCNTHLYWNPEFEYVKYGQLSKIFNFLEKKYKNFPITICGDFNSLPWSNVLKYVYKIRPSINSNSRGDYYKNKKFMEQFYDENKHSLDIRSAYENYKSYFNSEVEDTAFPITENKFNEIADSYPEFTNYTEEFNGNLDYILYSNDKLNVLELLEVPNHIEIKNSKLPSKNYPSDHLKIAAKFSFN